MATATPRLGLRQPEDSAPDDAVDVTIDIADSMQKIDDAVGAKVGTSFPVSPFSGQLFIRSDQLMRLYEWTGTAWLIIANGPFFSAVGTTTSIPDATDTPVPFATEITDTDNGHDLVTNNSRYTFPFKGVYLCAASVSWPNVAASTIRELSLRLNGTTLHRVDRIDSSANIIYTQNGSKIFNVSAGDYVEAVVHQTSGAPLALSASGLNPALQIQFLRSMP